MNTKKAMHRAIAWLNGVSKYPTHEELCTYDTDAEQWAKWEVSELPEAVQNCIMQLGYWPAWREPFFSVACIDRNWCYTLED